jgi:hypothetical protein
MKIGPLSDAAWRSIIDDKDYREAESQCIGEPAGRLIDGVPLPHVLVDGGFIEAARKLAQRGHDMNATATDGRTLLDVAAATGKPNAFAFAIGATNIAFRATGAENSHEDAFCKKAGWSSAGAQVPISEGMKHRAIAAIKSGDDARLDAILGSHAHEISKRTFALDRSLAHIAAINGRGASTVEILTAHNMALDGKDSLTFTPVELAEHMNNHEFVAAVEVIEEKKTSFRI